MSQHHILYALEDKPGFMVSLTAAVQHVLASFIGVVTPTLIIASALGLQAEVPYLISMALLFPQQLHLKMPRATAKADTGLPVDRATLDLVRVASKDK